MFRYGTDPNQIKADPHYDRPEKPVSPIHAW